MSSEEDMERVDVSIEETEHVFVNLDSKFLIHINAFMNFVP